MKTKTTLLTTGLLTLMLCVFLTPATAQVVAPDPNPIPVDLELSLLIDISGSVSETEYDLQRDGYVSAFNNTTIRDAIRNSGPTGKIAVNVVFWSNNQQEGVAWTELGDDTSIDNFVTALSAFDSKPFSGTTHIGSALNFATPLFDLNNFDGAREVIDISGDGSNNGGDNLAAARTAALAEVDTINGITITNSQSVIDHYINEVIGGTDAFHLNATSFADFSTVLEEKLLAEIGGNGNGDDDPVIPEPASLALLGGGLVGLIRRRPKRS